MGAEKFEIDGRGRRESVDREKEKKIYICYYHELLLEGKSRDVGDDGEVSRKNNYKTIAVVGGKMRGSDLRPELESMRRWE